MKDTVFLPSTQPVRGVCEYPINNANTIFVVDASQSVIVVPAKSLEQALDITKEQQASKASYVSAFRDQILWGKKEVYELAALYDGRICTFYEPGDSALEAFDAVRARHLNRGKPDFVYCLACELQQPQPNDPIIQIVNEMIRIKA
jgi:hypothetical protein